MKNILAVIDGSNFHESQLDPIRYITRIAKGRLTIAFLEIVPPPLPVLIPAIGDAMFYSNESAEEHVRERHEEVQANAGRLRAACSARGMDITLHTYTGAVLESVIKESRFADLLLVPHNLSIKGIRDSEPTGFITQLLSGTQCPVLTLPDSMQVIKELVLAYNGTYSSMYAIRTLFQLFPVLGLRKIEVVYVEENGGETIPDEQLLRHYLDGICRKVTYTVAKGDPSKNMLVKLRYKKHALISLGAYGRSRASRFFNSSAADDVLQLDHVYTFITHP